MHGAGFQVATTPLPRLAARTVCTRIDSCACMFWLGRDHSGSAMTVWATTLLADTVRLHDLMHHKIELAVRSSPISAVS